jgi:hypothetical protein
MKYLPNRDYDGRFKDGLLKDPMGDSGTYNDNGYR